MNRTTAAVTVAACVVLTGVQGIAPALPAIQASFAVTAAEMSLVTLAYVLAAAIVAFPFSAFGDRFGGRPVITAALAVFGACGLSAFLIDSFAPFVAVRGLQGAAFGVVLALSIALVSESRDPVELSRVQRLRVVAMATSEVVLPIAAGLILEVADWQWVFAVQAISVPAAVLCWLWVAPTAKASRKPGSIVPALVALRSPFGAAVQAPGFARFFLKFAMLTYFPLLATSAFDMEPIAIGTAIGASAAAAAICAALVPWLVHRLGVARVTFLGVLICAAPLAVLPVAQIAFIASALIVVSGMGDGILGVLNNVIAGMAAPAGARSAFLGATGSIRNLGKLVAPALLGSLVVVMPVAGALAVAGGLGLLTLASVPTIAAGVQRRTSDTS